jgi:hypothetical protein
MPGKPPLRFVPGPLPEPGAEPTQATSQGPPLATMEQLAQAAAWTEQIDDPEFRTIVSRAAAASLARGAG